MSAVESHQCVANLKLTIYDFGSDCKVSIDNSDFIPLVDYYRDGVFEPIVINHTFTCGNKDARSISSSEAKIEIYREWKGNDRLVFTRYVRIIEGENDIVVSFYGVKNSKIRSGIFVKPAEVIHSEGNGTNPTV